MFLSHTWRSQEAGEEVMRTNKLRFQEMIPEIKIFLDKDLVMDVMATNAPSRSPDSYVNLSRVVIAFIMTFGALMRPDDFTGPVHRFVHGLLGINMFWNACFFMYRTVEARTKYLLAAKANGKAAAPAAAMM